jgi:hypothetical protein
MKYRMPTEPTDVTYLYSSYIYSKTIWQLDSQYLLTHTVGFRSLYQPPDTNKPTRLHPPQFMQLANKPTRNIYSEKESFVLIINNFFD